MAIAAKVEEELTRMRFDRRPEPQPEPQPEVRTLDDMMVEEEVAIQHIKEQPRKKNVIKLITFASRNQRNRLKILDQVQNLTIR